MRDYEKVLDLKYGENPHQRAAYYSEVGLRQHLLSQVTQLHGKQLGFNNLYDLNAARGICDEFTLPCVTHHQAQQPVRLRARREPRGRLRQGLRVRSRQRLRQRHRRQPHRGRGARRAPVRAVRRGALRARLRRSGPRDPAAQGRHPHPAQRGAPADEPRRVRLQARHRRDPRPGQGRRHRGARRDDGGDQAPPERAGVGRPHLRVPGRQARQEQRHRHRQEPGDAGRGRRPDEPRGQHAHRHRQGAHRPRGRGRGLGRVLPVPGRRGPGHRQRRHRVHAAGRLQGRRAPTTTPSGAGRSATTTRSTRR